MKKLNDEIISEEIGLSPAYQIGAAYFLKYVNYKDTPEKYLWDYHLKPLLQEYLRGQGTSTEKDKIGKLEKAYFDAWPKKSSTSTVDS